MNKPYIICHMMTSIDGRRERLGFRPGVPVR